MSVESEEPYDMRPSVFSVDDNDGEHMDDESYSQHGDARERLSSRRFSQSDMNDQEIERTKVFENAMQSFRAIPKKCTAPGQKVLQAHKRTTARAHVLPWA